MPHPLVLVVCGILAQVVPQWTQIEPRPPPRIFLPWGKADKNVNKQRMGEPAMGEGRRMGVLA